MALQIRKNGSKQLRVGAEAEERMYRMWLVLTGRAIPDDPDMAMECEETAKIVLSWKTAPEDYVRAHLNEIIPLAISEWVADVYGHPLRPSTKWGWDFARKYGLMKGYTVTNLVTKRQASLF
jgi:hypothetical protein